MRNQMIFGDRSPGLVHQRRVACVAVFGNRSLDDVNDRRPVGMAVPRDTPPGLISSRRRRNKRSLTPTSVSSTSGIEATTSSVTSLGIVGPACWPEPSSLVLPGGHSAAPARPPKATSTTEPNPHDRQFPSAGLAVDHFHPLLFRRL